MKRILVPTDFSEFSRHALLAAAGLAEKLGATVYLLHVMAKGGDDGAARRKIYEESQILTNSKVQVEPFVTNGKDVEEIIHFKSDLIVMGSKGAHGLRSFFLGTHAESVAKHASVPVITIKGATDLCQVKQIVLATDLREEQEDIMEDLKSLQRMYGANLLMVKVFDEELVNASELEQRMNDFAELHGLSNYSVTVRSGPNEMREIIDFASEMKADMVAMATHDRQGLEKLFGGIISGSVINEINLPIWTKSILYS